MPLEKTTIKKSCNKCNADIVTSVMDGPTTTPVQCPNCKSLFELVSQRCADCHVMRFILAKPGGRTGNRCNSCIAKRAQKNEAQAPPVESHQAQQTSESVWMLPNFKRNLTLIVGSLIIAMLPIIIVNRNSTPQRNIEIGEMGLLVIQSGMTPIPVPRAEKYFDEMMESALHSDNEGLLKMFIDGKIWYVEKNTPVRVIGKSLLRQSYRIRITAGEYVLEEGWVPAQWVK